ncbi:hypothetical protein Mterra_01970 [Calidithermus terrae]|uniref:Uncharacterized protein n=1 Tax=Calidithermus terrae TaxID=1408545 RepID=A0A399EKC9_9DEIN|nr:hypothetical protein [Calidithermus terrae]RIH84475.1 hypothetical protein Mterra_01970 [Calidithermus terrae]
MLTTFAAILFAVLALGVVAFQVALAAGAPWGEFTLGGRYRGALPHPVRPIPVVSAILLAAFAAVVLARAGIAFSGIMAASSYLVWVVVAYCTAGALANYITPSRRERAIWFPVVMVMLASSAIVAMS